MTSLRKYFNLNFLNIKHISAKWIFIIGTYAHLICEHERTHLSIRDAAPRLTSKLFMSFGLQMLCLRSSWPTTKISPIPNECGFRFSGFNQLACFNASLLRVLVRSWFIYFFYHTVDFADIFAGFQESVS